MNRQLTRTLPKLLAATAVVVPVASLAQQTQPARPTTPGEVAIDPQTGRPVTGPAVTPTESAEEAAALMYRDGGSLFRASLATPQALRGAPMEEVSFFAVPLPEPVVYKKHDLVTVIVREESESEHEANTELEKSTSFNAQLQEYIRLNLNDFKLEGKDGGQALRFDAERAFEGEGSADRSDKFVARITAEVLDVKPNGTLVLQAKKRIVVDEEELTMILTGVCRTQDITADNSILSTQLYDLNLSKLTKGPVSTAARRGWLSKMIDAMNPF